MLAKEKTNSWETIAWKALAAVAALTMLFLARKGLAVVVQIVMPAAVIAYLMLPLQKIYEKRLSAGLSALLSILSLILPFGLILWAAVPSILSQGALYTQRLPELIDSIKRLSDAIAAKIDGAGLPAESIGGVGLNLISKLTEGVEKIINGLFSSITSMGKYFLSPVIAFYLLKDRKKLCEFTKRAIPGKYRPAIIRFAMDMNKFLAGYFRQQLVISLITGALTAIGLAMIGIDGFLFLGLVMAIFNLIPYFGPFIGAAPIVIFALLKSVNTALLSVLVVTLVQQIESLAITPKLISNASGFHPAVVILLILFGGALFGLWGLLLTVPAATILKSAWVSFMSSRLYGGKRPSKNI